MISIASLEGFASRRSSLSDGELVTVLRVVEDAWDRIDAVRTQLIGERDARFDAETLRIEVRRNKAFARAICGLAQEVAR